MIKTSKKSVVNIFWVIIFIILSIVLTVQYIMLFSLKNRDRELSLREKQLDEQILDMENQQNELEDMLSDEDKLSDYANQNGYYKHDEVYIID